VILCSLSVFALRFSGRLRHCAGFDRIETRKQAMIVQTRRVFPGEGREKNRRMLAPHASSLCVLLRLKTMGTLHSPKLKMLLSSHNSINSYNFNTERLL
jgi:hypothetical protein